MRTIRLFALLLTAGVIFQSISLQAAKANDGRQTRQISGFHGISVSSGIDLYLTQKNVEEVFVEAKSDELDKIITEVEGGILKIYMKDKSWPHIGWNNEPRKVYVSFKTLDKLHASAGSDVNSLSVLKLDNLDLDVSSGSDVKLELDTRDLRVQSSSGSDVSLKGKADVAAVSASSGSDIIAGDLEIKKCSAHVSSGSDINIRVTEEINAEASSGGDITYSGNPKVKNIKESSGGDVNGR
ncbi:MAG TPA: head GIN domain-containing protein [Prolixibacteraceae bacterium]|jgi:hypothetical protein